MMPVAFTGQAYKPWTGQWHPTLDDHTDDTSVPLRRASILMNGSPNIGPSGADTTAQLTSPAGKTTANFVAGRIQDDENPTDKITVSADAYTEAEWCFILTLYSTVGKTYTLRLAKAMGAVLDTYSVTPQITAQAVFGAWEDSIIPELTRTITIPI